MIRTMLAQLGGWLFSGFPLLWDAGIRPKWNPTGLHCGKRGVQWI